MNGLHGPDRQIKASLNLSLLYFWNKVFNFHFHMASYPAAVWSDMLVVKK